MYPTAATKFWNGMAVNSMFVRIRMSTVPLLPFITTATEFIWPGKATEDCRSVFVTKYVQHRPLELCHFLSLVTMTWWPGAANHFILM